jgi:hypothetical protein
MFDAESYFNHENYTDSSSLICIWQDQDALITALTELESSLSAAVEILHPDILNSEFPSTYHCLITRPLHYANTLNRIWGSENCCQEISL